VFEAMLETLAGVAGRDASPDIIDSTVMRAHHCAAGSRPSPTPEATFKGIHLPSS